METRRVVVLADLMANKGEPDCGEWSPGRMYVCTRTQGHDEAHVAHRSNGTPLALWEKTDKMLAAMLAAAREGKDRLNGPPHPAGWTYVQISYGRRYRIGELCMTCGNSPEIMGRLLELNEDTRI